MVDTFKKQIMSWNDVNGLTAVIVQFVCEYDLNLNLHSKKGFATGQ